MPRKIMHRNLQFQFQGIDCSMRSLSANQTENVTWHKAQYISSNLVLLHFVQHSNLFDIFCENVLLLFVIYHLPIIPCGIRTLCRLFFLNVQSKTSIDCVVLILNCGYGCCWFCGGKMFVKTLRAQTFEDGLQVSI